LLALIVVVAELATSGRCASRVEASVAGTVEAVGIVGAPVAAHAEVLAEAVAANCAVAGLVTIGIDGASTVAFGTLLARAGGGVASTARACLVALIVVTAGGATFL